MRHQRKKTERDQQPASDFDTEPYYDALNTGVKDHTIGVSVSEEMHQFWRELQDTDDVDVDPAQSIRNHLEISRIDIPTCLNEQCESSKSIVRCDHQVNQHRIDS